MEDQYLVHYSRWGLTIALDNSIKTSLTLWKILRLVQCRITFTCFKWLQYIGGSILFLLTYKSGSFSSSFSFLLFPVTNGAPVLGRNSHYWSLRTWFALCTVEFHSIFITSDFKIIQFFLYDIPVLFCSDDTVQLPSLTFFAKVLIENIK